MKLLVSGLLVASTAVSAVNPVLRVVDLLSDLAAKIRAEGEAEEKSYNEFVEWCADAGANKKNEIETLGAAKARHEADIAKLSADIDAAATNIETLASNLGEGDQDLTAATQVREKERSDFLAAEKELVDTIETLARAIGIIGREMSKNPAAFAQVDLSSFDNVIKALGAVIDAASFTTADRAKLVAFAQSQQASDDDEAGPPAASAYKTHSGGILDVLEDLKEKAEEQLSSLRKAESNAGHNYAMLKQSLEDQIAVDNRDMEDTKASKAALEGALATANKDLARTNAALAAAKEALKVVNTNCQTVEADHAASKASRAEELTAIDKAKAILVDTTGGAAQQSYGLLQVARSTLHTHADLMNMEVVMAVKKLAKEQHSEALAQLASRVAAVIRFGARSGDDVFAKVKGLITDMIAKLEKEAGTDATEKAYCDEQTAKSEAKKADLSAQVRKLTAKIDLMTANSAGLKGEVKDLQAGLAQLASSQAEMDKIRGEQNVEFTKANSDLGQGLKGVRAALQTLREYYGAASFAQQAPPVPDRHSAASGAGSSIIGILEVIESDFAKNLATEEAAESDAQDEYEKTTQENKITKKGKEQDVKYKEQDALGLEKDVAELTSDRETESSELAAVLEYLAQINRRCIAKPETYADRSRRREAEVEGLKEALSILENETAFIQNKKRAKFLSNRQM